jgi:hypothetical protein
LIVFSLLCTFFVFLCLFCLFEDLLLLDLNLFNQFLFISLGLSNDTSVGLTIDFLVESAYSLILLSFICIDNILRKVSIVGNPSDFVAV